MTSPSWIEPPPPRQSGMGCFAKGCLILTVFCVLLAVAFVFGSIYAVRHLRTTFFATENAELPANTATPEEQQLALAHWKIFERSARAHVPARIEMTAQELNALIAAQPKLRGKAYVWIENDVGRVRLSIPLADVRWLRGNYVNGECTVQPAPNGNPDEARISNVVLNGHNVDDAALTWRYPWSLRGFISKWTDENDLKTFEIREGKVILETKGSG
jgi:hypothetical protein